MLCGRETASMCHGLQELVRSFVGCGKPVNVARQEISHRCAHHSKVLEEDKLYDRILLQVRVSTVPCVRRRGKVDACGEARRDPGVAERCFLLFPASATRSSQLHSPPSLSQPHRSPHRSLRRCSFLPLLFTALKCNF